MAKDTLQKYNKEYYEQNKDKLSNQKKTRYATDTEYSKRVRAKSKAYKLNKKAMLGEYVERLYRGRKHRVLKIGKLFKKYGITRDMLLAWENSGVLPKAVFGFSRCYNDNQVKLILKIKEQVEAIGLKETTAKLSSKVKASWMGDL